MPKKPNLESKPKVSVDAPAAAPAPVKKARATTRKVSVTKKATPAADVKTMDTTLQMATAATVTRPVRIVETPDLREEIAKMAYTLWESRGRQNGSPVEDWLQAEQEVLRRFQTTEK